MKARQWLALMVVISTSLLPGGCAGGEEPADVSVTSSSDSGSSSAGSGAAAPAAPTGTGATIVKTVSSVPRKIIYTAEVTLVAETLSAAQQKLLKLVKTHQGYIAETEVGGSSGSPRTGRWKVRVPVDQYDAFMAAVAKLGELQTIRSNSQDVSAEYYDIEARLSNKRVEERRLVAHLEKSTARLRDILEVEREISRVRGEIEQMQGRLRVLSNQTELTTVTVSINEVKDYVPPAPPTFQAQIARTFQKSMDGLRDFVKTCVLVIVALSPLLVIFGLIAVPFWLFKRRRKLPPKTSGS